MTPEQTLRWILDQCVEEGDCRLWRGAVTKDGTPTMTRGQKRADSVRRVQARALGKDPTGRIATTTCDNPLCMAEEHLVLWTRRQLQKRSMGKKAGDVAWSIALRKAREPVSKLSMEAVREIRATGMPVEEVMERWGVAERTAHAAKSGETWRDFANPFAGLLTA